MIFNSYLNIVEYGSYIKMDWVQHVNTPYYCKTNETKYCIKGGEKCSNPIYISREGERYFIGE
jgi:hypothetical protein